MLTNYFKIAIAVLKRRKFFTFISLFGISFTLSILILVSAFLNNFFSGGYPSNNPQRLLYINFLNLSNEKTGAQSTGAASFNFLDRYVRSMKTPEAVGISSVFQGGAAFLGNKKLVINMKYTNAAYWHVLNYRFLEGRELSAAEISTAQRVAVISEDTRNKYFGENTKTVGKYIEVNNIRYRVCGVVENVPITSPFTYSDIYLPYTLPTSGHGKPSIGGGFTAIILARKTADIPAIQQEYKTTLEKIPLAGQEFDKIVSAADFYAASLLRNAIGNENSSGVATLILIVNILALFFILLPALNLMNITVSRMIERSSEIGVRKAFGASSSTLVYQFIIENLILTGIGGLLGLIFSALFLMAFNKSGIVPNISLGINYAVLGYALVAAIVLGLLSGVYPAWRMSRLQIINSLKIQR